MHADAQRWNDRYRQASGPRRFEPDARLQAVAHLLGPPGSALELACGTGASAMWLAAQGWSLCCVDVSIEGVRIARGEALRRGLSMRWVVADAARPALSASGRFALIVVMRFLDRRVFPFIREALAPGGQVFYATFNQGRLAHHRGFNPRFVLAPGELRAAFPGFEVQATGDEEQMSWLLARKPGRLSPRRRSAAS